jgi:hypothetical protein
MNVLELSAEQADVSCSFMSRRKGKDPKNRAESGTLISPKAEVRGSNPLGRAISDDTAALLFDESNFVRTDAPCCDGQGHVGLRMIRGDSFGQLSATMAWLVELAIVGEPYPRASLPSATAR